MYDFLDVRVGLMECEGDEVVWGRNFAKCCGKWEEGMEESESESESGVKSRLLHDLICHYESFKERC